MVGAPYEEGSSYRKGSALAPAAIRRASHSIESYSAVTDADLNQVSFWDAGDLSLSPEPEQALDEICRALAGYWGEGKRVVLLGGDHSVTIGAVRALLVHYPKAQVVILDAHSDMRDDYDGRPFSHACTARRIRELVSDRIVLCGVRSLFGAEDRQAFASPQELVQRLDLNRPLYLSIDMDALDPSLCPGVGNPEPGGLSYQDVVGLLSALEPFACVGLDIVEVHPPYDPAEVTAVVAAKLIQEAMLIFWRDLKRSVGVGPA